MSEPPRDLPGPRAESGAVRVVGLAERQWGVVSRSQLADCGLSNGTVSRWVRARRLHRVHPGVYALGHRRLRVEGRLAAALLYAGQGSALSHTTAAWWWGISSEAPQTVHVSTRPWKRSLRNLSIHNPRHLDITLYRRFPVTPVPRTLLDISGLLSFNDLRQALSEAMFLRLAQPEDVQAVLGRGHPGSEALRRALRRHLPQLAATRSELERRFLYLCERFGIGLPEVNVAIAGHVVDAVWRQQRVVVELDSRLAHGQEARVAADRARDLALREAGYVVLRYGWEQVTREPGRIAAELRAALGRAA